MKGGFGQVKDKDTKCSLIMLAHASHPKLKEHNIPIHPFICCPPPSPSVREGSNNFYTTRLQTTRYIIRHA